MRPKFHLRLRTEILLNLAVIMVFSMLLLALMVLKFSRDFMEENAKNDHLRLEGQIKRAFRLIKGEMERPELQSDLTGYINDLHNKEKASILLFSLSPAGPSLVETGDTDLTQEERERMRNRVEGLNLKEDEGPILAYSKTLFVIEKLERIESFIPLSVNGSVAFVIYLSKRDISGGSKFRRVKLMVVVYTAVFALIMIVFGYVMLSKSIINPLERISAKAVDIASGNLDSRIEHNQQNEIGELARSITVMTEKLLSNQRELEENLRAVEKLNKALSEAQREIVRIEKLASIGRLSSGIAHEIGNPLSAIVGYVDILRKDASDEQAELLERSANELQRISKIIKQLLDFSRPAPAELKSIDLERFIKDRVDSLKGQDRFKNIDISCKINGHVENVTVDEDQLNQILLNLFLNGADAIRDRYDKGPGGSIAVTLSESSLKELDKVKNGYFFNLDRRKDDPPESFYHAKREKKRRGDPPSSRSFRKRNKLLLGYPKLIFDDDEKLVQMTVEDNGIGIKKEDMSKIFDPFYTTKDPGKGTGLGLFMTANIVDSLGGYIDVYSEFKKGTVFMILLPIKGVLVDNL